jgi:hypothetical protein
MSRQWILCILCIAAIMLYVRGLESDHEGFLIAPVQPVMGTLPEAIQASYIPRDSASATTANPDLAKPDYRDWVDARDSFTYFLEIYTPETAADSGADPAALRAMFLNAPLYIRRIHEYILNPEAIPSRDILEEAKEARQLADAIRRVGPADPNPLLGAPLYKGCLSLRNDDLMAI